MAKKKVIAIRKGDEELFSYLHAVKISKIEQIKRDTSYREIGKYGASKRLQRLERAGFIEGLTAKTTDNKKAYGLTRKAFKTYLSTGEEKRKELKSDSIKHDLALVDIRHTLFDSPRVKEYFTENTLQTWKFEALGEGLIPFVKANSDATLKISTGSESVYIALEYEATRKYSYRYQEILKRYYTSADIPLVLYIFEKEEDLKRVISEENKLFKDKTPKFFYSTLERIVQRKDLNFNNRRDEILQIGVSK